MCGTCTLHNPDADRRIYWQCSKCKKTTIFYYGAEMCCGARVDRTLDGVTVKQGVDITAVYVEDGVLYYKDS